MRAIKDNSIVGTSTCLTCGAKLEVERGDLRIKQGGLFGLAQIAYIECPLCNSELPIQDKDLWRFGLKRE